MILPYDGSVPSAYSVATFMDSIGYFARHDSVEFKKGFELAYYCVEPGKPSHCSLILF